MTRVNISLTLVTCVAFVAKGTSDEQVSWVAVVEKRTSLGIDCK